MPRFNPFPDAEAAAGWSLRNAGIAGGRVYSSIPTSPTYPLVVLRRIGGQPAERHYMDASRIQVDVWGNSKSEAFDLAQSARVILHDLEGKTLTTGGGSPVDIVIQAVDDDLGLQFMEDAITGKDRYIFGVQLYVRTP